MNWFSELVVVVVTSDSCDGHVYRFAVKYHGCQCHGFATVKSCAPVIGTITILTTPAEIFLLSVITVPLAPIPGKSVPPPPPPLLLVVLLLLQHVIAAFVLLEILTVFAEPSKSREPSLLTQAPTPQGLGFRVVNPSRTTPMRCLTSRRLSRMLWAPCCWPTPIPPPLLDSVLPGAQ